jgi:hypothetical protein
VFEVLIIGFMFLSIGIFTSCWVSKVVVSVYGEFFRFSGEEDFYLLFELICEFFELLLFIFSFLFIILSKVIILLESSDSLLGD